MRHPVIAFLYPSVYLAALLLSCSWLGWLLAAFQVPWPIWLGSLAVMLHLIKSGPAAIALAGGWVVGVMALAATRKSWAAVWGSHVPYQQAQLWAEGLLLIWLAATGLVLLLAFAGLALDPLGWQNRYKIYSVTGLVWGAFGGGWIYYQLSS